MDMERALGQSNVSRSDVAFPNHTVFELLQEAARKFPVHEAIVFGSRRLTFRALAKRAERLAASLVELGVKPGDHVGILLPNGPEFVEAYFAIAAAGATIVPISTRLGDFELEQVLGFSDISVLFSASEFSGRKLFSIVQTLRPRLGALKQHIVVDLTGAASPPPLAAAGAISYASLFEKRRARFESPRIDPEKDIALLLFTSGTTSRPKGVMLTHRNIVWTAYNENAALEASERDRFLIVVPFFHVFGAVVAILCAAAAAAPMIVMDKFEAEEVLALIEREKCTIIYGTPTMFVLELAVPSFDQYDLGSLRTGMIAAAPCPVELIHQIMTRMHCNIAISYGLTETSPALTITRFDDSPQVRASTVGKALPGIELKVVDDERNEVPRGVAGELASRGYANMQGYYKSPELTAEVMDRDGWLYTGDMASMDDRGYVRILSRKKDMIKRGGFAIFPPDVESFLYRHPGIQDAAVIGIPDPVLGERSRAYIIRKKGVNLDEAEVIAFCKGQLSDYKVPDQIRFVDSLPTNASGKVHKVTLREQALDESAQAVPGRPIRAPLIADGSRLTLQDVLDVCQGERKVELPADAAFLARLEESIAVVRAALAHGLPIYGINTNFGGLADETLDSERASLLQENLLWGLKCSIGDQLPASAVRAAMLIRANMLSKGASGVRHELIARFVAFLNEGITPIVNDVGSLGASGDLIPLSQIAGALIGLDASYRVEYKGQTHCLAALESIGLGPMQLMPKEGLALVNGTSVLSGLAVLAVCETQRLLDLSLWINALFCQALTATPDSFDPFVHELKPHPGQALAAAKIRQLLRSDRASSVPPALEDLVQDRYSIRCLPQFYGALIEGLSTLAGQVETEINSVDDNPLIDVERGRLVQAGNFYGQHVGTGMDQLRQSIALIAKQLDAQISLLVMPEFSRGLPSSLAVDDRGVKFGLKGLQICANSIVPRLLHLGNPIVCFFPTHAEQFNQNINSQAFNAAVLAAQSVTLFKYYLATALLFAIQGVELRAHARHSTYSGTAILGDHASSLYEAFYGVVGHSPTPQKPLVEKNYDVALDTLVNAVFDDLGAPNSKILGTIAQHRLGQGFL
jgi:phenylalanine ammonia-lyase